LIENGQFNLYYPNKLLKITSVSFPVAKNTIYNYTSNVDNALMFNFSDPINFYNFKNNENLVVVNFNVVGTGSGDINLEKVVLSKEGCKDALSDVTFTETLSGKSYVTPKISATKKTIYVKKSVKLNVTGGNKGSKVTWKSSKPKVATVKNGKVVAKKAGKTVITATKDGKKLKCNITVKNPTVKAAKSVIGVKKTTTITVKNAVGKTKFKTMTPSIAKVSANGVVTGLKKGNAKIQVTASGVKFTVKIKVK
jgi:hypothetical protein